VDLIEKRERVIFEPLAGKCT